MKDHYEPIYEPLHLFHIQWNPLNESMLPCCNQFQIYGKIAKNIYATSRAKMLDGKIE